MTGQDGPSNEFVYGETGLTWASIELAMDINEPVGPSTRNQKREVQESEDEEEQRINSKIEIDFSDI